MSPLRALPLLFLVACSGGKIDSVDAAIDAKMAVIDGIVVAIRSAKDTPSAEAAKAKILVLRRRSGEIDAQIKKLDVSARPEDVERVLDAARESARKITDALRQAPDDPEVRRILGEALR